MDGLFVFIKTVVLEILPEVVSVLIISAPIFLIFIIISYRTKDLIKKFRLIWYIQSVLLFLSIISVKSIAYTFFGLNAEGLELVDKTSQTLLWLLGTLVANQALHLFVWEGVFLRKYKSSPPAILMGLATAFLYLIALYGIMTIIFARPMTGLIVSSGIVAGVLGLAMQSSLADLIAGVSISIERPFKIGDWIELDDGTLGEVVDINWRATHIKSWNNSLYILPNARISNARVHNYHRPEQTYCCWVYVHIPSTVPPALARRVLLEAAIESDKVLDNPAPVVRVSEAGGSYKYVVFVNFKNYPSHYIGLDDFFLRVWVQCARHGIVPSAVTTEIILRKGIAEEIKAPSPDELLSQIEIFSEVDDRTRQKLISKVKVHTMPEGKAIVSQGDLGTSLFVISAGMVRVVINTTGGNIQEVKKLGSGEYFGEMSLLAHEPRSATVIAHTDCQLLEIDKNSIKTVFDLHPELMQIMAHTVSTRRLSNDKLTQSLSADEFNINLNTIVTNLVKRMKNIFS